MGNSQCVPQAPRRLRASFSRKPSLKANREDNTRKLAGLFGVEAGPDGDSAADRIFYYIPGTDVLGLEGRPEGLEQPFLSVFKKGRRRVPVRNLGKVVHYAKVQLRFQHSQDVSDCFLELFPSHLYFQAHGSEGLTFQGLLPLLDLSICPLEGYREHAFQITGPLPAPLLVLCPTEAELSSWLYHLEKQMALVRGLQHCHTALPKHHLSRLRRASGRESLGGAICASRVKLQHLPSQEQWDRLLVLYPTSLAIFSEEPDGLSFKGELPLSAIHINLEEEEKQIRSFLIEGRLINTIRVVCASYEDYSHWLLCLQTISRKDGAPLLPNLKSPPGPQEHTQVVGGGRGSVSSDGRTSWDLGCPTPSSFCTSPFFPESSTRSTVGCPAWPTPDQANPDCASAGQRRTELRRGGSSRLPRGKARREAPGPAAPLPLHLDLAQVGRLRLEGGPEHSLETPHSPLYADPYTPPATSHHKITDVRGLDEFLSAMQISPGPEPSSPFPSVPVSVPVSDPSSGLSSSPGPPDPHLLSKKGALQSRSSQRHQGSIKDQRPRPSDSPQLVSPTKEGSSSPLPSPPDGESPIWNKTSSSSNQKWPQLRKPEAERGFIQWI
ncbi:PREDICTED: pleckstrin homology domain-containing family N member 1 isoform X2 [Chinchilla lanigera]|uniref:pleckstrin homology domain-containing family N member 1 isoform X2 n=1 Tax=Chinchilla lanigera TaxID=34839 RepID=UPI00038F114A|nr:PREDICTED: pleckstrin homology domain-containing family N member 1 isoform X2 [Chinchilla lanigera]